MTQDKFAQVLSPSIGRPDVLKMRASAKNRKNRKHRKDNGKNDKGRWDTWQPPKRKKQSRCMCLALTQVLVIGETKTRKPESIRRTASEYSPNNLTKT